MSVSPTSATKKEKNHARAIGQRFDDALARATMLVRSSGKLTGLDKIRAPIAWRAALKATGYEFDVDGFVFPKSVESTAEITEIASELYDRAVTAARQSA